MNFSGKIQATNSCYLAEDVAYNIKTSYSRLYEKKTKEKRKKSHKIDQRCPKNVFAFSAIKNHMKGFCPIHVKGPFKNMYISLQVKTSQKP